jgi:hypothetical protein
MVHLVKTNADSRSHLTDEELGAVLESGLLESGLVESGLPAAGRSAHLAECPACQTRLAVAAQSELELLLAARLASLRNPGEDDSVGALALPPMYRWSSPTPASEIDATSEVDVWSEPHPAFEPDEHSGIRSIAALKARRPWPWLGSVLSRGASPALLQLASCAATVVVLVGAGLVSFWVQPLRGKASTQRDQVTWTSAGCHSSQSWCAVVFVQQ